MCRQRVGGRLEHRDLARPDLSQRIGLCATNGDRIGDRVLPETKEQSRDRGGHHAACRYVVPAIAARGHEDVVPEAPIQLVTDGDGLEEGGTRRVRCFGESQRDRDVVAGMAADAALG